MLEIHVCFGGEIHERVCFTIARGLRDVSLWQRQSDRRLKRTLGTDGGLCSFRRSLCDQRPALGPLTRLALGYACTLGQGKAWSTSALKPCGNGRRSQAERETFTLFGQSRGRFVLPGARYCVFFTLNWRIFLSQWQSCSSHRPRTWSYMTRPLFFYSPSVSPLYRSIQYAVSSYILLTIIFTAIQLSFWPSAKSMAHISGPLDHKPLLCHVKWLITLSVSFYVILKQITLQY